MVAVTAGAERGRVPGRRVVRESLDEQARRKGIRPVRAIEDMAQDGVFESDDEVEAFIAHIYASRHADLA